LEVKLAQAEECVEGLEGHHNAQQLLIELLMARLEIMEGQLCHCGKGKAREPLVDVSSILGSPLILDQEGSHSDDSYYTPPTVGLLGHPSSSSPIVNSNKENQLVIYDSRQSLLVPIEDEVAPLPVREPSLDFDGISWLIMVRGQRAVRSKGHPRSSFHPYSSCCRLHWGQRGSYLAGTLRIC